jgi:hypothetical protein
MLKARCCVGLAELAGVVCDEVESVAVISSEATLPFSEKIVGRKTIVYETLVDPAVVRIAAENLKYKLFVRYGFFKPLISDVSVVCIEKFYKPFIKVSGRYSIDYFRKRVLTINAENSVSEVVFPFACFKTRRVADSFGKMRNAVVLEAEEHLKSEAKASLVLDESGRDVSLMQLPTAPSEKNPEKVLSKFGVKEVPRDLELSIVRTRIQKRPVDISWIANEIFEVDERLVVYAPRFRVLFKHVKSGKERVAEFDGVTGKLVCTCDSRVRQASI